MMIKKKKKKKDDDDNNNYCRNWDTDVDFHIKI